MSSAMAHMGPSGGNSGDGPESFEEIDIPGFPKALSTKQSVGFAASLQVNSLRTRREAQGGGEPYSPSL